LVSVNNFFDRIRKRYLSDNAYQQHLQSNKHREAAEKGKTLGSTPAAATESKVEPDVTPKETVAPKTEDQKPAETAANNTETKEESKSTVSINNCLFCNTTSNTFKQ
jgi:hypothetical protein